MDHILPWLLLKNVQGVGNHLFKRLIDRWKTPEIILNQPVDALMSVQGISRRLADEIQKKSSFQYAQQEIARARQHSVHILCMHDDHYPPLLKHLPDPPPVLYVYGRLNPSDTCVAIVGSRNATPYGASVTRKLAKELAMHHITIVSGMARGIDTAAHEGALAGQGRTIAVMGCGLEIVYPGENKPLFHWIAKENGAVISEFPMQSGPEAYHFPLRNRIISGMSMGTIVVEAGAKSGSLITARLALEQDRQVFAVPGHIHSRFSNGTHRLIKQGAKLIENAQDVLEDLGPFLNYHLQPQADSLLQKDQTNKISLPPLDSFEQSIWDKLTLEPIHIDELLLFLDKTTAELSAQLLHMELKGIVKQHPGKRFSKDENYG
ncbi:MAG: DNA-protecting protein DprA [Candidatus Magnetomorum sp.]|nr:DNA-protecting protein DprA [Candidatus Magnetomorum sp.]